MKKRILPLLLAIFFLLSACSDTEPPEITQTHPEAEIQYDWMAGESPIPNKRIGFVRAGLQHSTHVVTDTGTYFIYHTGGWTVGVTPPSPWIVYVDHGSDMVIKLCGRPDCTHDDTDCNAFVDGARWITYDNGYIYVVAQSWDESNYDQQTGQGIETTWTLYRINPDGTDRVAVLDMMAFAKENGGSSANCYMMSGGYCLFGVNTLVEENGQLTSAGERCFCYKLDGSMGQPRQMQSGIAPMWHCGDMFLGHNFESKSGNEDGCYWAWDLATDTTTYLLDHPGAAGWFGRESAYYFKDGALRRLTYADGQEEILMETDLKGVYYSLCLPDCLILVSNEIGNLSDANLYIYNWAFELVDTVTIPCDDNAFSVKNIIVGETAERIILDDGSGNGLPRYYINKAEFGTGKVKIYEMDLSDLADIMQNYQDYLEDREWFENG